MLIPLILLAIPVLEIAVFILVGEQIGVLPTLAIILLTAILGTILLRIQGFALIAKIRAEMEANRVPGKELAHGAMLLAAGFLLLTPGFVTDTIGFLLFIPPIRNAIWRFLAAHMKESVVVQTSGTAHPGGRQSGVVDLDPDDFSRKPDPTSPWNEDADALDGPKDPGRRT